MVHFKVKKHSFPPPARGALYPSRLFSERDWELRSSKDMSAFPKTEWSDADISLSLLKAKSVHLKESRAALASSKPPAP